MAKLNREDFISALKEMSILEIKELVDAMKEEFGVDPSAVAVAAVEEGPSKVNVVLTAAGANKIAVIKIVRDLTSLGLKEAKDIADNGGNVKEGIDKEEADPPLGHFGNTRCRSTCPLRRTRCSGAFTRKGKALARAAYFDLSYHHHRIHLLRVLHGDVRKSSPN